MNIDDAGHRFGLNSMQYRNAARRADMLLSNYINLWLDDGYQIIVTSDHGMNNDLSHGGNLIEEREVPFILSVIDLPIRIWMSQFNKLRFVEQSALYLRWSMIKRFVGIY